MIYNAHPKQSEFHLLPHRYRGAFSGKRGGKTECGAVECIIHAEGKIGWKENPIDPPIGVIIAPTTDMLRRLALKKFLAYAEPFDFSHHETFQEITWHNGHIIYGLSGDRPRRLEGVKANWIWMDEVFQMSEDLFLEAKARVSDTQGKIWVTGSLGTQYTNPKSHWVYKHFFEHKNSETAAVTWSTAENPYFPQEEVQRLKESLDPRTYRQLFEIDWNVPGSALVYPDFDDANVIRGYSYNPGLETIIAIDWGWAHPMVALFFQYDRRTETVFLFDEIVGSGLTLQTLWDRIMAKQRVYVPTVGRFKVDHWYCDIAGNQEREQSGQSNIAWFKQAPRNVHLKYRRTAVQYGLPIVRSYIKNGMGQRRFFIDETRCPKTLDGIRNYSYPEKNGVIQNENPIKRDDDCADALRYFFVNHLDYNLPKDTMQNFNRWGSSL